MIRAVIFDYGGVLVRVEDRSVHQRWEERLVLTEGNLPAEVWDSDISVEAALGLATPDDVWAYLAERFGLTADAIGELRRDFFAADVLDERLVAFIRSLRPRYKTAILSNAWSDARDVFTRVHGLDTVVDTILISAEVGLLKPDPRMFALAAARLGVAPQEAIFVDDVPRNVDGAQAAGMHGIHFQSTDQTTAEIRRLLGER